MLLYPCLHTPKIGRKFGLYRPFGIAKLIAPLSPRVPMNAPEGLKPFRFLTTDELAKRWIVDRKTLARWRRAGAGPRFVKLGRHVVYVYQDILDFEQSLPGQTGSAARDLNLP